MQDIAEVVEYLTQNQLTLSAAESCTAGLLCALLADVSGCGAVLHAGFIVYSAEAKQRSLGVSPITIEKYGLTSEEVAREMAEGALQRGATTLAVAITGKAESDDDLDGVVCIAYASALGSQTTIATETVHFPGSRNEVRKSAARYALVKLPDFVKKHRQA